MKKMIAAFAVLAATALNSSALILQTKVAQGDIEGVEHNGAALYKRIPYAEAPVGIGRLGAELRVRHKAERTEAVFDAAIDYALFNEAFLRAHIAAGKEGATVNHHKHMCGNFRPTPLPKPLWPHTKKQYLHSHN